MQGIKKSYRFDNGMVPVLHGIDLTLNSGDYVSIAGPSGSGKSTLLNIIGCLDSPDSGHYHLAGQDIGEMNDSKLTKTRNTYIGYIFQNFNLLARMSALENVETPLIYAGVSKTERFKRASELLDRVELSERMYHQRHQLSGGQQQRVAIARALINKPPLILADEPTGNLDQKNGKDIINLLEKINREENVTILLITHDMSIAERTHSHYRLIDGRLTQET